MEMVLINKNEIPNNPEITKNLRYLASKFNGKTAIRIMINKNEKTAGIESAWRKICRKEYKKEPHIKIENKPIGKTVWLWMDS